MPKICSMCFRIYVHGEKFCVKWKVYLGRYEYLASSCRYIIPKLCSSERAGKTHNPSVEYPPDGNKKRNLLDVFRISILWVFPKPKCLFPDLKKIYVGYVLFFSAVQFKKLVRKTFIFFFVWYLEILLVRLANLNARF